MVDLNLAYNPFCAYRPEWSFPIPPSDNRLTVPIRAGEKSFPGAHEVLSSGELSSAERGAEVFLEDPT